MTGVSLVVRVIAVLALVLVGCGGHKSGGDDDGTIDAPPGAGSGAPTTCIVGDQGCLCDSTGGCRPGLTCTEQTSPRPNLCCDGTDCSNVGGTVGATCSMVTGAPSCTPGITIPAATTGNDNCGYPTADFVESDTLCTIEAVGGGATPAIIRVYYNDEHALTLGCETPNFPLSPLSAVPDSVFYPQTGDPDCVDAVGRPLRPMVFITDISVDSSCNAGDLQQGGPGYDPVAIFGTWKGATENPDKTGTPLPDPMRNDWNLTSSGDPVPATALACTEHYGTEVRFEVGLISGHSYRIQVIVHDGDQNKGGDSGEACVNFCAGTGTLCDPGVVECVDDPDGNATCPDGTSCVQGCCLDILK